MENIIFADRYTGLGPHPSKIKPRLWNFVSAGITYLRLESCMDWRSAYHVIIIPVRRLHYLWWWWVLAPTVTLALSLEVINIVP